MTVEEGWYLMSVSELERLLAVVRDPAAAPPDLRRLTNHEAMTLRNTGNIPDAEGRSLRLVLHVRNAEDVRSLSTRRLRFEPDFHETPTWRREGSVPINVVPLRMGDVSPAPEREWWDEPEVAELEAEWARTGTVAGINVPGSYRSFVYKTVLSLRAAGRDVSVDAILGSVARWLDPADVAGLRSALEDANR